MPKYWVYDEILYYEIIVLICFQQIYNFSFYGTETLGTETMFMVPKR